jgi:hypothetical protein
MNENLIYVAYHIARGHSPVSHRQHRYEKKPDPGPEVPEVPKQRFCLMCHARFASAWSGERVCQHCKTTVAWREGVRWPPA